MSSPERAVAFYNLELTCVAAVTKNFIRDGIALGIMPPELLRADEKLTLKQEQQRLLGWLANKKAGLLDPLLEHTAAKAPERMAPWSILGMHEHVKEGYSIGVVSVSLLTKVVKAHVEVLQVVMPDANFRFVMGRGLKKRGGICTGGVYKASKDGLFGRAESMGYRIGFAADSFESAWPAMDMADHQLLVNAEQSATKYFKFSRHRLTWNRYDPALTRVIAPHVNRDQSMAFRLDQPKDQQEFLQWFREIAIEDNPAPAL